MARNGVSMGLLPDSASGVREIAKTQLRSALMICQEVFPGGRPSQNVQPFTGFPVMDIAAAEGESNRSPFRTRAPFSTLAR